VAKNPAVEGISLHNLLARLHASQEENLLIAIDGPAGAGKTTLASRIHGGFSGSVHIVHMDDLYDGWENALTPQLTRVLVNQIATPFSQGKSFGYRRFDWFNRRFGPVESFPAPDLLILEGVGSGQRALGKFLAELIWIDIDDETGLSRVLNRDGEFLKEEMLIWQHRQSAHFQRENTRDRATLRLDGKVFI
jgi:hypothetical protein